MIFRCSYMSSIQSPNMFLSVGFLKQLLGNRIWPVKGVRSLCDTFNSKHCYGNSNVNARLYSLSSDIFNIYLLSVTEQKPTEPKL